MLSSCYQQTHTLMGQCGVQYLAYVVWRSRVSNLSSDCWGWGWRGAGNLAISLLCLIIDCLKNKGTVRLEMDRLKNTMYTVAGWLDSMWLVCCSSASWVQQGDQIHHLTKQLETWQIQSAHKPPGVLGCKRLTKTYKMITVWREMFKGNIRH